MKKTVTFWVLMAALSGLAAGPVPSSFEIISFSLEWRGNYSKTLWVIGEIRNNGPIAAGVELEVIARNSAGVLVGSKTFWPNSISNLPPGESCGIGFPITENTTAVTGNIRIVQVKTWK